MTASPAPTQVALGVLVNYRLVNLAAGTAYLNDDGADLLNLAARCDREHPHDDRLNPGGPYLLLPPGEITNNLAALALAAARHERHQHADDPNITITEETT